MPGLIIVTYFLIVQKSHEIGERRAYNATIHDESQRIPDNYHVTSLSPKLRYISIGIRAILLVIGITFIVMDSIAMRSNDLKKSIMLRIKVNTWLGIIVSKIKFIPTFYSFQI